MNIPDKVKIGIYEYSIVEVDTPLVIEHQECNGLIEYDKLSIKIKRDLNPQKKLQTFMHEIIHGIVREWGADLAGDNEEAKVDWIATGLLQVIKDNPEIFKEEKSNGKM